MTDLRAQLKGIEAASPPDLWSGIEARAMEEGPEMDTNIGSVVAFRGPGAEQRRRIAAGLVAATVVGLVVFAAWRSFQPATTKLPIGSHMPAGWDRCTNSQLGYSIGYPGDWHTTDVFNGVADPANACQWFSPTAFGPEGNPVLEGWGYPLEVGIRGSFEQQLQQETDPELVRIVEQEELVVDGHRAVRIELETLVDVVADTGLHYEYLVELDQDTTLVVHTTETRGIAGDYDENKAIVDDAVDSLRFEDPAQSS
jgi:hypothetical protein